MTPLIQLIRPENFRDEVITEPRIVLLLCMPHDDAFPQQLRVVEEVAEMFKDKLKAVLTEDAFIEVFKKNLHIIGTPTILILRQGKEIARVFGISDREPLTEVIRQTAQTVLKEVW
ncbi:MAG: hypothetical protein PHN75_10435 [Syntrophales bacterium]|nr:hypothetical protein [Syntrophales bacterium]